MISELIFSVTFVRYPTFLLKMPSRQRVKTKKRRESYGEEKRRRVGDVEMGATVTSDSVVYDERRAESAETQGVTRVAAVGTDEISVSGEDVSQQRNYHETILPNIRMLKTKTHTRHHRCRHQTSRAF